MNRKVTSVILSLCLAVVVVGSLAQSPMPYPVWVEGGDSGFLPSARIYHDVVQDSKGNLWLFGGSAPNNSVVFGDLFKMDVRNNYTWSLVDTSASIDVPSPRRDFCWSIDKNDNIFLYGGTSTSSYSADKPVFGDLWMFNTSSLVWTLMRNSSGFNLDGRNSPGVGSAQSHPGTRVLMTCWFDDNTNSFWIYGGYFYFSYYGDVWSYSIESGIWSWTSGKLGTDIYADSDVQIGVPYTDKFPGSAAQVSSTKDPDGNVWIYGGWLIGNYCNQLWRFKMTTLEWTFFGGNFTRDSLETVRFYGVYNDIGAFSTSNHPPANLYGALVYAGDGKLALLTQSFLSNELYMSQSLWHYKIDTNEWALMYVVINKISYNVPPNRGTFQQVDPTANIGQREGWGRSRTMGNIWITRGSETTTSLATTDTLVFPAQICKTDLNPCSANADCTDHIGWADCVCKDGYEGDGKTCNQISGPHSGNNSPTKTPIKARNSAVKVRDITSIGLLMMAVLLF